MATPPLKKRTKPRQQARGQGRQQDRLIGYLVLGLGCLALLAVGAMAYTRYRPPVTRDTVLEQPNFTKEGRGKRLTPKQIEGDWESSFADYTAVFQAHDGFYQIIAQRSYPTAPRRYVRGTYRLEGSVMHLVPDTGLGSPAEEDPENVYFHLGRRESAVDVRFHDGVMLWFAGPPDPEDPDADTAHALIHYSAQDYIYWTQIP